MKHIWSVLCKRSVIDNETNLLSLFDSLEQLTVTLDENKVENKDKVNIPIEFHLVSFWLDGNISKEREFFVDTDLYDPNNKKLSTFSGKYQMKKGIKRFRSRIIVNGLPTTVGGDYLFKIKIKDKKSGKFKEVAELPLDVKINYKILDIKK